MRLALSLEKTTLADLAGRKIVVAKENHHLLSHAAGQPDEINGRVEQVRRQIEEATSDYDKEKLQEHASPSWPAETWRSSRWARRRDRDEGEESPGRGCAARHPRGGREGVVAGGGVALIRALQAIKDLEKAATKTSIMAFRSRCRAMKSRCARSSPTPARKLRWS